MMLRQKSIRYNIGIMFVILCTMMVAGLYLVQRQARDYAAKKAAVLAIEQGRKDRAQDRYNIKVQAYNANKAACGIRKLVDIDNQRKLLATYINATHDKTLNQKAKDRNAKRIIAQRHSIENGLNVIDLFNKIPEDFDCSTLAPHPPKPPNIARLTKLK